MTASASAFDSLDDAPHTNRSDKPIWALNLDDTSPDNEKKIHEWLLAEKGYLESENHDRFEKVKTNIARYRGIQFQTQDTRENRQAANSKAEVQKIVANHTYDLVQQRTSKLVKYKPGVVVLPTNDEFTDKISAEMTESWLRHIWYVHQFEGEMQVRAVKSTCVMGEVYLFIEFDFDAGDTHHEFLHDLSPEEQEQVKKGGKVTLKDENGQPVTDDNGNPIEVSKVVKNGEVSYSLVRTTDVLLERKENFRDSTYLFRRKGLTSVEEARLKYPGKEAMIKANGEVSYYDFEKMQLKKTQKGEVELWIFYLKRCPGCPDGRMITFTRDGIVENKKFPYSHDKLPCTRLYDGIGEGELHGYPTIENVAGLTGAYNNITNMMLRNYFLLAHPKWTMPAGAAKLESLGNDITIVQFKGPVAPQLVSYNSIPSESFQFRKELKEEFQQIYGVFGVSRGEPPPGIKAGIALQFLSEQENERHNEMVLRYNEWIRESAQMTIAVAGDYYDEDDQRLIRIMGKNNRWMTTLFKASNLSKDYDVMVQNSSALPQSKAARTQTLMDLKKDFPAVISDEQFLDMLELAQDKKFIDSATVAVRAAEAENEALLDPNPKVPVNEPEEYEDHIGHWKIHVRQAWEWGFKHETPEPLRKRFIEHVMAHEMLMIERGKLIPEFAAQLKTLPSFPLFFKPNLKPVPPPPPVGGPALPPVEGAEGPMELPPEAAVNPASPEAAEPGALANEPPPSLDAQAGNIPPVEPTGAI